MNQEPKMNEIPKVYLAAGWFTPAQNKQYEEVFKVLKHFEDKMLIDLFVPKYYGICLTKEDPHLKAKMKVTWWLDIEQIKKSDLIVAITVDKDVGTIYETGYARGYMDGWNESMRVLALAKTVVCYDSDPQHGLNLMLAQEARAFCKNEEELTKVIRAYLALKDVKARADFRHDTFMGIPI